MSRGRITALFVAAVLLALAVPGRASEDKFPNRPIDIVVPWGPGGGIDQMARKIALPAGQVLGVAMPVSNVPGASGMVGMAKVAQARADGYTVAAISVDFVTSVASGTSRTGINDYIWLCRTQLLESYLFVRTDSPFRTIHDLLSFVKANPRKVRVAIVGFGSPDDIALQYLMSKGFVMVPSPQPNPGERYAAAIGGHAEVLYEQAGDVRQFLASKQLRPIVVFSEKRSPSFPDVPSSGEVGLGIFLPQWRALIVRAGTPPARVNALADAFKEAAETPQWKTFLQEQYADPGSFMGPAQFGTWVKGEFDAFANFMKQFGMVKR